MKRLATTLVCILCLIAAPAAGAARNPGLFGVVMTPDLAASPASILDPQMALMARSGVQSLRTGLDWETTEVGPGLYDWRQDDLIVREAAMHHLSLLPIVEFTPAGRRATPPQPGTSTRPSPTPCTPPS